MRSVGFRAGVRCGVSALAMFSSAQAVGQTVPAQAANTATGQAVTGPGEAVYNNDEIIVTANKRSESVQRVPISVVAIAPQVLSAAGVLSTTQLQQVTPGFSFSQSGEAKLNSFYVRGVGTYALSSALESSVGVAVDGVPLARVGGSISDIVDIERVEVLKGPQGTLFGKNATAGLVSIVSRKPELGVNSAEIRASYGSFNEFNIDGAVNVALGNSAALRLTAWRFGYDGFVYGQDGREYNNKNSYGARLGLKLEPSSDLSITLLGQYDGRDDNGTVNTFRKFNGVPPFATINEPYELSTGIVPSPRNRTANIGPRPFGKGDNYYITGLIDYDLGGGYSLSSVTSYRDVKSSGQIDPWSTDSPAIRLLQLRDDEEYDQFTQELRLSSPTDQALSFVAGLFYYDFKVHDVQLQGFRGTPVPGLSQYTRRNIADNALKNYAAFGELTWRIVPGIRLLAGLRQSHDKVTGSFARERVGTDVLPIPGSAAIFTFTPRDISYNTTSYRIGGQVDIARDVMAYATASRGYKAPGFNLTQSLTPATIVNDARVEAEIAKSIEVGIKSQFFDRKLTINISAFDSTFSNFQTTVGIPTTPPTFIIQNAPELKSTGVEFEISARPIPGLSLGVNGAYIDARYTDFDTAACYPGQPTRPVGTPLTPGFCIGGLQTLDDYPLANSPKFSLNASVRYETALTSDWRGFAGLTYSGRTRTYYEANRNPDHTQGGYGFFNLNAGVSSEDGHWTASVYARNIFKSHFVARVRDIFGMISQLPAYESQRRIGVMLEAKY